MYDCWLALKELFAVKMKSLTPTCTSSDFTVSAMVHQFGKSFYVLKVTLEVWTWPLSEIYST